MDFFKIIVLASLQGFAELLPVSSSAHVILAQKMMGLNPSSPEMTFLLVMLHTGTMFAVLVYFWKRWRLRLTDKVSIYIYAKNLIIATAVTGFVGLGLKLLIEKVILERAYGYEKGEVESLFSVLPLIGISLLAAGIYIIFSSRKKPHVDETPISNKTAAFLGFTQGLCLPFRGLSRSGVTISSGLLKGMTFQQAEEFSFALAVLLTPPVVVLELRRLLKANLGQSEIMNLLKPGLIGMLISFGVGLIALKLLSSWLEKGRWAWFGYYCLVLSAFTFYYSTLGV